MQNNITSKEPICYRAQYITSNRADVREGRTECDIVDSFEFETKEAAIEKYTNMNTGAEIEKQLVAVYSMDSGEYTEIVETTY